MAFLQKLRDRGRTRTFLPADLPEAGSPAQRLDLNGHPSIKYVVRVAVLPGSGKIATACEDGRVRVFDAGGNGNPLVDIRAHEESVRGLAVLGEHVLASGSRRDSKVHTWDVRTGERIHTIDIRGTGVGAIAAVGPETLVVGLTSGALVFIQHIAGRQLAEVARHEGANSDRIVDIAWHEDVLVTASRSISSDKMARVWSVSTRRPRAVLRGHRLRVDCAAVNSRIIATGSRDDALRLYANRAGFSLISVLDGLHMNWILTVQFIGSDLILSGAADRTVCFTAVSPDARPIARMKTGSMVKDTAVTADGQIAWAGLDANAGVYAPPLAVADAAKAHALATFGSVPLSSAVVQHEPPPPLQTALVDAHAGRIMAGQACRELINAERCSASISEWWCGHRLLMQAVRQGEVAGECGLDVGGTFAHNHWFQNLYLPVKGVKKLSELGRRDRETVNACLAEAKDAGVIEGVEPVLVAIEARRELQEEVTALQEAQKEMLMALSIALLEQASARAELARLGAELTRMDRVQKISLLMSAIFSVAPFAGGAAAGAGVAAFGMAPDLIESILGFGVGLEAAATPLVVDRFVRQTAHVIGSWAAVTDETRKSILAAAEGLGMTREEFCDMILTANDVVLGKGVEEVGEDGLDGVVVEELEDVAKDRYSDAEESSGSKEFERVSTLDMGCTEAKRGEPAQDDERPAGNELYIDTGGDYASADDQMPSAQSYAGPPTAPPGVEAEVARAFAAIPRGGLPDAPIESAVSALRGLLERVGGSAHRVGADDFDDALEAAAGGDALRVSPGAFCAAFFALVARGEPRPPTLPPAFRRSFCDAAAPEAVLGSKVAARVLLKVCRELCAGARGTDAAVASVAGAGEVSAVSAGADDASIAVTAAAAAAAAAGAPELDVKTARAVLQDFADERDRLDVSAFERAAFHALFGDTVVNIEL